MTAKDYLSRTLGALSRAWSRSPATFLDHDIRDPQTIANRMVESNMGEEEAVSYTHLTLPTNREV